MTAKNCGIDAFGVFEGGAAAGMVHVGGLMALRDVGVRLVGAGGASAGSIVAAAVAAGITPEELLNTQDKANWNIFRNHRTSPVAIIGRFNFVVLRHFISIIFFILAAGLSWWITPYGPVVLLVIGAVFLATWMLSVLGGDPSLSPAPFGILFGLAWTESMDAKAFLDRRLREAVCRLAEERAKQGDGFAKEARSVLDRLKDPRAILRFYDLQQAGGLPLKIAVTNISRARLEIFGTVETPEASLVDAVVSSMSIPFVFPPATIRRDWTGIGPPGPPSQAQAGDRYVDGGLIGNLPIWTFVSDRRTIERTRADGSLVPIIGFSIDSGASEDVRNGRFWIWTYLARVARTGIFGSQREVLRMVPGTILVSLTTSLGSFDFDCPREKAQEEVRKARKAAEAILNWRLVKRPEGALGGLKTLQGFIEERRNEAVAASNSSTSCNMRLCFYRLSSAGELEVVASIGREHHADRLMSLEASSPLVQKALRDNDLVLTDLSNGSSAAALHMTTDEYARLPARQHHMLAIPVAESSRPVSGVVLVDSDQPLDFLDLDAEQPTLLALCAEFAYVVDTRPPPPSG